MTELNDDLVRAQLAWLANGRDDTDWNDVLYRAHRSHHRRALTFAAAAGLAVAGVASALVLANPSIDFLHATKAPPNIVRTVSGIQTEAPPGMAPGVIPGQTRRITEVTVDGKQHVLYVAPTKAGGFCEIWSGLIGGCLASRTAAYAKHVNLSFSRGRDGVTTAEVSFFQSTARRATIRIGKAAAIDVPFVWVTAPIDAGFFAYVLPHSYRPADHLPITVSLYDAKGRRIDRISQVPVARLPSG